MRYLIICERAVLRHQVRRYSNEFTENLVDFSYRRKRSPPNVDVTNQYSWISSKVNPLVASPYSEQLRWKFRGHRDILIQLGEIANIWKATNLLPCKYDGVLGSPRVYAYRNKETFHIGYGVDGDPRTVGQTVGSSSRQDVFIVSIEHLISSPPKHREVLKAVQRFLLTLPKTIHGQPFPWRDGFLRSNLRGEVSLCLCLNSKGLPETEIQRQVDLCVEYFSKAAGSEAEVQSIHIKLSPFSCNGRGPFKLVYGRHYLREYLMGKEFQISPDAFFQVNSTGAEVLYAVVRNFASMELEGLSNSKEWTLLDACCGTGTIGIILSDTFKQVVGFDAENAAIENAKRNAALNGVRNSHYLTGQAKSCLRYLQDRQVLTDDTPVVAVVNPSRGGLGDAVIKALRANESIKRIVYVSCNPGGRCFNNFELLCRTRKKFKTEFQGAEVLTGDAFAPTRAISVDMFPHTYHCEMVICFDRK